MLPTGSWPWIVCATFVVALTGCGSGSGGPSTSSQEHPATIAQPTAVTERRHASRPRWRNIGGIRVPNVVGERVTDGGCRLLAAGFWWQVEGEGIHRSDVLCHRHRSRGPPPDFSTIATQFLVAGSHGDRPRLVVLTVVNDTEVGDRQYLPSAGPP